MNEKVNTINPAEPAVQLSAEDQAKWADTPTPQVPTAVETLEALEQTLDNLDPVDARTDEEKAADAVIAEVTTFKGAEVVLDNPEVEAVEAAPVVPEGTGHPFGDPGLVADPSIGHP